MNTERLRELIQAECRRLARLGVEGIAAELASRGMAGRRGDACECPVSRAIADTLMIGTGAFQVMPAGIVRRGISFHVLTSLANFDGELAPLRAFVMDFDKGKWPHLAI